MRKTGEAPALPVDAPAGNRSPLAGERRHMTVVFCDLVDSTPLSGRLDPEELRAVLREFHEASAQVVQSFGGHIGKYLGDGLLIYFGYPRAHEDDAERAVRAGLGIVEAIAQLNVRLQRERGVRLATRLGIHTGLVVVGEIGARGHRATDIVGEAPNVADRLQELAQPNTVAISATTYRLVQEFFECQPLGARRLRGLSRPIDVYQVQRERGTRAGLGRMAPAPLTPLVGRETELSLLRELWKQARRGAAQVVLLRGEPGIGKTRLLQALKQEVRGGPHAWLAEFFCSPHHRNTALYPVIEALQHELQFERDEAPAERLRRIESFLAQESASLAETVPLLASLLSVPPGERYAPLALSSERLRQRILETLVDVLLQRASRQPGLVVVENLHWIDPTTQEFLGLLMSRGRAVPLLIALLFRPEYSPPWPPEPHVTQITLERLGHAETERMVGQVIGGTSLPVELLEQVVAKTDGIPLFIEEVAKMVAESGLLQQGIDRSDPAGPISSLEIPSTLQDLLMARLDHLATVKEVVQSAAVLGRQFSYELLKAVMPLDAAILTQELDRLVEAGLLHASEGERDQATYRFKHALIQDAAYETLLRSRRQEYHARAARVLEERFAELSETQPELLAYHYTRAGSGDPAIAYWLKAGQRAIERSAYDEAINHLTIGLGLVKGFTEAPERIQQELMLRITLGTALIARRGFGAAEVGETFGRAHELCQWIGDTPQLFPALWGLWVYYLLRAEYRTARQYAEDMLRLGERERNPAFMMEGHWTLGDTLFWLGELEDARTHLQQAVELYDSERHRIHAFLFGQDSLVACHCYLGYTLWHLGYPDQALKHCRRALRQAREVNHPFSVEWALIFSTMVRHWRGDVDETRELAEATIEYSTEQALPFWLSAAIFFRGWAVFQQGDRPEGMKQMSQGIAAWLALGSEVAVPDFMGTQAEAYAQIGQTEAGLALVDEALVKAQRAGEKVSEIELYRIRGELLLRLPAPDPEAAERCFQHALELARAHRARSRELQTAVSLSRLWRRQGRTDEARRVLSEIYDWFTEGFATRDQREARALLATLA